MTPPQFRTVVDGVAEAHANRICVALINARLSTMTAAIQWQPRAASGLVSTCLYRYSTVR